MNKSALSTAVGFTAAVSLHGREVNDGELWNLWYTTIPAPDQLDAEISRRLGLHQQGAMVPFSVIEKTTNKAVGVTTYMNIDAANRRLEIGATWYRKRVQRTAVNTECKFLLLGYAFEQLECIAVEFRTHFFNRQSRAGIERLGAKLDWHPAAASTDPQRHAAGHLRLRSEPTSPLSSTGSDSHAASGLSIRFSSAAHNATAVFASSITLPMVKKP